MKYEKNTDWIIISLDFNIQLDWVHKNR